MGFVVGFLVGFRVDHRRIHSYLAALQQYSPPTKIAKRRIQTNDQSRDLTQYGRRLRRIFITLDSPETTLFDSEPQGELREALGDQGICSRGGLREGMMGTGAHF